MAKRYNEPVSVYKPKNLPPFFIWKGRRYDVTRILRHWTTAAAWWKPGKEDPEFFSVMARPYKEASTGVYELRFERIKQTWSLMKVMD